MADEQVATTATETTTAAQPAAALEIPNPPENILANAKAKEGEVAPAAESKTEPEKVEGKEPEKKAEADKPAFKAEDYKLKLPEGLTADDPALTAFVGIAAEEGISPELAQKIADKVAPEFAKAQIAPYEAWNALQQKWQDEVRADPEIGGAKLESTVAGIARVLDQYGGPDGGAALRQALDTTGAGNNPAIVRFLANVAKAVNEGAAVRAEAPPAAKSYAEIFYPNMVSAGDR